MKRFILTTIVATICTAICAQNMEPKKNAIDIGTGATLGTVKIFEHKGQNAFATGIDFSLRYTRFFDRHWGAFIQGDLAFNSAPRNAYFGKVKALDGNRYAYNWFKTGSTTQGRSYSGVFVGGTFRYDIRRWSLRPRMGIGVTGYNLKYSRYYRTPTNGDDTQRQAVMVLPSTDEGKASFTRTMPAGKVGMQFKYSITDCFHLGADIDFTFFMSRHEYTVRTYSTKKKEQGLDDVIAGILTLGLSTLSEDYMTTDLINETHTVALPSPITSIKFSLGWDF